MLSLSVLEILRINGDLQVQTMSRLGVRFRMSETREPARAGSMVFS